jgi:protein-S-isoprenylcysteine O-methyltransferase Ste14
VAILPEGGSACAFFRGVVYSLVGREMGILGYVTIALSAVWVVSEFRVNIEKRSKTVSRGMDKNSLFLFRLAAVVSISAAVTLKVRPGIIRNAGGILSANPLLGYFGCVLMVVGLVIRWIAASTLKQYFTVNVSIQKDQTIIDTGMYKSIRHPAYLGSLLSFFGLGLALENWFCLLVVFTLPSAATLYRFSVEEKVLIDRFGEGYERYAKHTRRMIPGIF